MKLNKSSSYSLLHLLDGDSTASAIASHSMDLDVRSIQRALQRLTDMGLVNRQGPRNNPTYEVEYLTLLTSQIPASLLEDEERPETNFHSGFIDWLSEAPHLGIGGIFKEDNRSVQAAKMSPKELEHLTIELSWKSSALEGNTYTLLDTQLLLTEGIKAKNRTEFETQMILNHKNAISFISENPELFEGKITFAVVEELHKIIGHNLGIAKGIRKKLIRISASNYVPLANPHLLRENADRFLEIISSPSNVYLRSLFALSLIPYLQIFEDGNKRTGRILANAILISSLGKGFSLRKVDARELALAYLTFYEFNSMLSLANILGRELAR